jgi:hypothetical protein
MVIMHNDHYLLPMALCTVLMCIAPAWCKQRTLDAGQPPVTVAQILRLEKTHFVGCGSAKLCLDRGEAHLAARSAALADVAAQIRVSVISHVNLSASSLSHNNAAVSFDIVREKVSTHTDATFSGWREIGAWETADGCIRSVVALDKAAYFDDVNRRSAGARQRFKDILAGTGCHNGEAQIRSLSAGMIMLDTCFFPGDQAERSAMAEQLHERMTALLAFVEIRPLVAALRLGPTEPLPRILGVEVFFMGKPDSSLAVRWAASDRRVACVNGARLGCRRLVSILSLPPTQTAVEMTASLVVGDVGYELARRGFAMPTRSFSIARERVAVYCTAGDAFNRSLMQSLSRQSTFDIAGKEGEAHFTLESELTRESEPVVAGNLYLASARLGVRVLGKTGNVVMNIRTNIRGADGRSAAMAVRNTEVLALAEAVRQIEGAF